MQITGIDELRAMGGREIVELSGWKKDAPFVCELKQVGMYELMAANYVPNPLVPVVRELFMGMKRAVENGFTDPEDAKGFVAIARAAMLNPTYDQVREAGLDLTDRQVLEIFFFATRGASALAAFRKGTGGAAGGDGAEI